MLCSEEYPGEAIDEYPVDVDRPTAKECPVAVERPAEEMDLRFIDELGIGATSANTPNSDSAFRCNVVALGGIDDDRRRVGSGTCREY